LEQAFAHKGLIKLGFKQSSVDECVYYRNSTIFLCYVNDTILIEPSDEVINNVIQELKDQKFNVTDEGQIKDYLRVRIEKFSDGRIKLSQPHIKRNGPIALSSASSTTLRSPLVRT
jgi:hypothetical protein